MVLRIFLLRNPHLNYCSHCTRSSPAHPRKCEHHRHPQLPDFLKKKRGLAEQYQRAFDGIEGVSFFTEPDFAHSNYWLNILLLDENLSSARDDVLEITNNNGIQTRPAWTLMHRLPMYFDYPRMDLSVAESLESRLINIPSSARLGVPYAKA